MKKTVVIAMIEGLFAVIVACITAYGGYRAGANNVKQKIDNKVSQVVEVDNGNVGAAIDYIISQNEKLEKENSELKNDNIKLNDDIDSITAEKNQLESKLTKVESNSEKNEEPQSKKQAPSKGEVRLKSLEYFSQSNGNIAHGIVDADADMLKDNTGEFHTDGFYYVGNSGNTDYRTYKLSGKYNRIKGCIAIPFTKRDTDGEGIVRIFADENVVYESQTMTSGVDPEIFIDVDISNTDKLKFEFTQTNLHQVYIGAYDMVLYN